MTHTILVVEDEPEQRDALECMLRLHGYRVEVASNGLEALDCLRQMERPPALVLLDLNMPVMDGWGFLAEVAADPDLRQTPVVITAAPRADADLLTAPLFIAKPLRPNALLHFISERLRAAPPDRASVPPGPVVTTVAPLDDEPSTSPGVAFDLAPRARHDSDLAATLVIESHVPRR